jgi:T6SS, Phospholipase effector Tle1-like, catalytic domain
MQARLWTQRLSHPPRFHTNCKHHGRGQKTPFANTISPEARTCPLCLEGHYRANYDFWGWLDNIVRPLFKIYLDQLIHDFYQIAKSLLNTVWQLSLYSLLPGLAGLIYRRNFLAWFLASFLVLLLINVSGVFGSLTTAEPMPGSGTIFFFILSQLVLLILAYRLRRHVQSASRLLPPKVHNWGLMFILVAVGVACWQGWGPGYRSGNTVADATSSSVIPTGFITRALAGESTPASGPSDGAATTTDAAVADASSDTGPQRSWIWSFLGHGITGLFYKWEFILIGLPLIYTLLRNSASWPLRKRKNIVICLDGTSNTPDQMEHGFAAHTNVYKLFKMLKSDKGGYVPEGEFDASLCKKYTDKQIGFYFAGVGNRYDSDPILQTLGMAMGMGAGEIIERAYLDLVRVYQPGDRVFIVGFSRGAAIARLLARTIDARGAPRAVWTLKLFGKHRTLWASSKRAPVRIDVLGCWDTVGSFGVAKTIAGINFQQLNLFKDLTVPDNVAQGYHMLALDAACDHLPICVRAHDQIAARLCAAGFVRSQRRTRRQARPHRREDRQAGRDEFA